LVLGVDCKGQALYGGKIEVRKVRLAELHLLLLLLLFRRAVVMA